MFVEKPVRELSSQVAFDATVLIGMAKMLQTVPSETTGGLPIKEETFLSEVALGYRIDCWPAVHAFNQQNQRVACMSTEPGTRVFSRVGMKK